MVVCGIIRKRELREERSGKMEQRIKYNPKDYVDYLEESMTLFAEAMQAGDVFLMEHAWRRMYNDTKQAMKEGMLSPKDRDEMLFYYDDLIPNA